MTLEQYIDALKEHDWFYMYADDYRSFDKGKAQWMRIAAMQTKLDPDYIIFNEYAPNDFKVKKETNNA